MSSPCYISFIVLIYVLCTDGQMNWFYGTFKLLLILGYYEYYLRVTRSSFVEQRLN